MNEPEIIRLGVDTARRVAENMRRWARYHAHVATLCQTDEARWREEGPHEL